MCTVSATVTGSNPVLTTKNITMEDLIKALQIFLRYKNETYPTHCEHDVLIVVGITEEEVTKEDQAQLERLGFRWSDEYDGWASYKYGSA